MGGTGSGRRPSWDRKHTVDESLTLAAKHLAARLNDLPSGEDIYLTSSWSNRATREPTAAIGYWLKKLSDDSAILTFQYNVTLSNGEREHIKYELEVLATPCNFGGQRWWFVCPGKSCGKRIAEVHMPPGQNYLLCRSCHDLTYASCQESHRFDGLFKSIASETGLETSQVKDILSNM